VMLEHPILAKASLQLSSNWKKKNYSNENINKIFEVLFRFLNFLGNQTDH